MLLISRGTPHAPWPSTPLSSIDHIVEIHNLLRCLCIPIRNCSHMFGSGKPMRSVMPSHRGVRRFIQEISTGIYFRNPLSVSDGDDASQTSISDIRGWYPTRMTHLRHQCLKGGATCTEASLSRTNGLLNDILGDLSGSQVIYDLNTCLCTFNTCLYTLDKHLTFYVFSNPIMFSQSDGNGEIIYSVDKCLSLKGSVRTMFRSWRV